MKNDLEAQLLEQYDVPSSVAFYRSVLSDGGYDIHYGVFQDGTESLPEAARKSIDLLADLAHWARPLTADTQVMDLGAGFGGATHRLVERYGCQAQCFNLSEAQNEVNLRRAGELGIADRVAVTAGNFEKGLPAEWSGRFDVVWSQDVFCHVLDREALFKEIRRCLRPGGVLAFSDVMRADHATAEQARSFSERNAVGELASPRDYRRLVDGAGLNLLASWDLSHHLIPFFERMLRQIDDKFDELRAEGVAEGMLRDWRGSVADRITAQRDMSIAWGVFIAQDL
ncbi:SAM-dependent methyltransferase [Streptomyces sp. LZ34]